VPDETEWLDEGERALRAGDWIVARDAFQEALGQAETPEALNGLGEALWWLGATQDSIAARERAYAAFRHRRNPAEAAGVALGLCVHYRANMGNAAASAGWLARAERLVDEFGLEDLRGWLLLMQSEEVDPVSSEALARQAGALPVGRGTWISNCAQYPRSDRRWSLRVASVRVCAFLTRRWPGPWAARAAGSTPSCSPVAT